MNPTICFFLIDFRMIALRSLGHFPQAFPAKPKRLSQMSSSRCTKDLRPSGSFYHNLILFDQSSSEYSV